MTRARGVIRPRDLADASIRQEYLWRLYMQGHLDRIGRGLYRLPDAEPPSHSSLAEAAKRLPAGRICLLTALRYHDIGTQNPAEVWVALPFGAFAPTGGYPPLRVVHYTGAALTEGVEIHNIGGVSVPIYSVAKTVADCFKYRNKIGLDVALEALRDSWQQHKFTMDELDRYARICRVSNVMRPYLEALVA